MLATMSIDTDRALSWRSIAAELRSHRREIVLANLAALLAVIAAVPVPLLLPLMVDEVLLQHPARFVETVAAWTPAAWHGPVLFIGAALLLALVLRLIAIVLNVWQGRSFSLLAKEATYRIRVRMLNRLSRIAVSAFETVGAGRVTSHFITDLNAIDTFLGASISGFIVSILTLTGVAAVLFWMHWQLALFILLLNPPVILLSTHLGKRVKELKKVENRAFEVFQDALSETLDALTQIRAMNREKHYLARIVERADDIRRHAAAFAWKSDAMSRAALFVFLAGFDIFRALAMLMVVFSDLTIGEMLAVFGYLWFMMTPVQELVNMQYAWFAAQGALGRINALLGMKDAPAHPALADPFAGRTTVGITLEHVHFAYEDAGETILDDVSLDIRPGEKVALVGASGGGKSTLVQALLGLYPVKAGRILYGGVPVTEIGWETVREHVGVVLQHPVLFNDDVRANLTLGREASDAALWQALAAWPGHGGGAAGRAPVGRTAAEAGDRAHDRGGAGHRDSRRGDLGARHRHRAPPARGDAQLPRRPHHAHHCAPAVGGAPGRPHPGVRERPRGGGGRARGADRKGRAVSQALPSSGLSAGEKTLGKISVF